jgi:formate dehydrogenase iron-sulfur subunit
MKICYSDFGQENPAMAKAILYDSTLCIGCRACEDACAKRWNLAYTEDIAKQERLSATKLTAVQTFGDHFSRRMCMHCAEPTCASVCPVGAFQKTPLGAVVYNADRCIGCRYCMMACPFQVPTYQWSSRLPVVRKCDFCYERQSNGQPTACTEACPVGATINGERDELIDEARKRLAAEPEPSKYFQRIYGLQEVGGTSVLYLSSVPFEQIGLKANLPHDALPTYTWQALSKVPDVVSMGSVLLGGVYWITHRREEVARAEGSGKEAKR